MSQKRSILSRRLDDALQPKAGVNLSNVSPAVNAAEDSGQFASVRLFLFHSELLLVCSNRFKTTRIKLAW